MPPAMRLIYAPAEMLEQPDRTSRGGISTRTLLEICGNSETGYTDKQVQEFADFMGSPKVIEEDDLPEFDPLERKLLEYAKSKYPTAESQKNHVFTYRIGETSGPLVVVTNFGALNLASLCRATKSRDIVSDAKLDGVDVYGLIFQKIKPFASRQMDLANLSPVSMNKDDGVEFKPSPKQAALNIRIQEVQLGISENYLPAPNPKKSKEFKPSRVQIKQNIRRQEVQLGVLRDYLPSLIRRAQSKIPVLNFADTMGNKNTPELKMYKDLFFIEQFQFSVGAFVNSDYCAKLVENREFFRDNDPHTDFTAYEQRYVAILRGFAKEKSGGNLSDIDDYMQHSRLKLCDCLDKASTFEIRDSFPAYLRSALKNRGTDLYRASQALKRVVWAHTTNAGDISNPGDTNLSAHIAQVVAKEWDMGTTSLSDFTIYRKPHFVTRDDELAFHNGRSLPYEPTNALPPFEFRKEGERFTMAKSYGLKVDGEYPSTKDHKARKFERGFGDGDSDIPF